MKKLKQDRSVRVSANEYFTARDRWNIFWVDEIGGIPQTFHHFLGISHGFAKMKKPDGTIDIRGSAARKIGKLNSAHYHVFLKAHKIRHPLLSKQEKSK